MYYDQVNDHINLVHKGVRPFPCEYDGCEYTALNRSGINLHVKRVHEKVRSVGCPHCDYKTDKNYALQDHINSRHLKVI